MTTSTSVHNQTSAASLFGHPLIRSPKPVDAKVKEAALQLTRPPIHPKVSRPLPLSTTATPCPEGAVSTKIEAKDFVAEFERLDKLVFLNAVLMGPAERRSQFSFIQQADWVQLSKRRNKHAHKLLDLLTKASLNWNKENCIQDIKTHFPPPVADHLIPLLTENPESGIDLAKQVNAILYYPPAKKSLQGDEGPTFLVSYPFSGENISYVLKFTDKWEIIGHKLYDLFATGKVGKETGRFFYVPEITAFDLETKMMVNAETTTPIGEKTTIDIAQRCHEIVANYVLSPKIPRSKNQVIARTQKIEGKNLTDFITNDYKNLSPDMKKSLFRRLGRIGYMDFLLGHTDRLIPIDATECQFESFSSNLDNIMASASEDRLAIYLIDNGVNQELFNPEGSKKYSILFKEILDQPTFDMYLASQIKKAMEEALLEVSGEKDPFRNDLKEFGRLEIKAGIQDMDHIIRSQSNPYKEPSGMNPGIFSVIEERLKIAKEAYSQRESQTLLSPMESSLQEIEISSSGARSLLDQILQHCNGSREDAEFFKCVSVPYRDDDTKLEQIFNQFHKIRNSKQMDSNELKHLKALIECHIDVPHAPAMGMPPTPIRFVDSSTPLSPLLQESELKTQVNSLSFGSKIGWC